MESYKQHKEMEQKVHDCLYNNLMLLSHFYPTTKDFNAIFRKDMFIKNNKAAFFEVIHYLLNILSPELTKQKLTSWPLQDIKMEAKFRTEVISYINELNAIYPHANIPTCQTSTLISPGGFRFAKFMLKVSQLVMYKHLERSEESRLLFPLKPHKSTPGLSKAQLKHLNSVTSVIDKQSKEILDTFEHHYEKMKQEASEIRKSLTKLNKDIQLGQKQLSNIQIEFDTKHPSYPSAKSLEQKLAVIEVQVQKVVQMNHLFVKCEELLKCISGTDLLLEYNEETLDIPEEIQHIIGSKHQLDLVEFFHGLAVLMEKKALELADPTKTCIEHSVEAINKLAVRYRDLLTQLEAEEDHINGLFDQLKVLLEDTVSESENTLAVPLPL